MSQQKPSYSEYETFQKRIIGDLHGILMRGEVLRRGERQASEVWDLVHSHSRFDLHYGQYRPELIKKFGPITNSQFFAATIGDKLNFGDPLCVFRDCFGTLDQFKDFLETKGIAYEWNDPPDLHSTILLGAHYLLAPEIIQLGSLIASDISGILLYDKNHVIEFLRRNVEGDHDLLEALVRKGVLNRWFFLRKESLYLHNPYESLAPSLISRSISKEIIIASRVAYLVSLGFHDPLQFEELIQKGSMMQEHEESTAFFQFLAEKLYSILKRRVLRSVIEKAISGGFLNLSGFSDLGEIALSIYEYARTEGIAWANVQELVTSSAISALNRSSKPSIKRSMPSLGSIQFGSGFDTKTASLDIPTLIGMLRGFYNSARVVLEERRTQYLNSVSLGAQDVRADYKQQVGDLQGRIELVGKSHTHLVRHLIEGTTRAEEDEFIAKTAAFLSTETFSHLDDKRRERAAKTIFEYLSRETRECRKILGELDLRPFLIEEVALLLYVLRLGKIPGVFSREWNINSSIYIRGKAAQTASRILREWLVLPRDKLVNIIGSDKINECMLACGRNDIRNFYLFAAIEHLNPKNVEDGLSKIQTLFPNPIRPGKRYLFFDGNRILQLLTDGLLVKLSEEQWNQ